MIPLMKFHGILLNGELSIGIRNILYKRYSGLNHQRGTYRKKFWKQGFPFLVGWDVLDICFSYQVTKFEPTTLGSRVSPKLTPSLTMYHHRVNHGTNGIFICLHECLIFMGNVCTYTILPWIQSDREILQH